MSIWYALCNALPIEMLQWNFMKNAFLALLLMAPLFGILSTMIVTGHMSFFSDALGHSAFTGIAIGSIFGIAAPTWAAVGFSVLFALLFSYIRRGSSHASDTLIGVFSSGAVALGILVATVGGGSFTKYNKYLIGDVLSITPAEIGGLTLVLLAVLAFWCLPGHSRGPVPDLLHRGHRSGGDAVHLQHGPSDPQLSAGAARSGFPESGKKPEAIPSLLCALRPFFRDRRPVRLLQLRLLCRSSHQPDPDGHLRRDLCLPGKERLMDTVQIQIVARMHSDFPTKFGIPRQSGLVEELKSFVVFEPEFRNPEALRGIEEYSHLWLIWQFSQAVRDGWSPTVRPPRLGGNTRMGVFATRSPFRPNNLALSCVKLLEVHHTKEYGDVLVVGGADLMDGTPIFDIKPYIPYSDAKPDATGGFTDRVGDFLLKVDFPRELLDKLPEDKREAAIGVLSHDPRPSYQRKPGRIYGLQFAGMDIRFTVEDGKLTVVEVAEAV